MALRALKHLTNAVIRPFTVASGQTVYLGKPVVFSGSDTAVQDAGTGSDLMIGVVLNDGVNLGLADSSGAIAASVIGTTQTVEIALAFPVIVPMLVGTGGSTRGKKQIMAANGITDAPAVGNTTEVDIIGVALQTGVAGDIIGVGLQVMSRLQ